MAFWEYVSVQSAGEYIKYMSRWKQWPMLYSRLHSPFACSIKYNWRSFCRTGAKMSFLWVGKEGEQNKRNQPIPPLHPCAPFLHLLRDSSCEEPGAEKLS